LRLLLEKTITNLFKPHRTYQSETSFWSDRETHKNTYILALKI
jgi:hypothetical protein